ncbi:MAG: hypothetical protein FJX54_03745 [Alphaproteobacteria bacterium]|nr:hypothetical protein [Alphaproteobacteria bacterium]
MKASTCATCGGTEFGVKLQSINDSKYEFAFIQCAGCGVPVGIFEEKHVGHTLEGIIGGLRQMNERIERIEKMTAAIGRMLEGRR